MAESAAAPGLATQAVVDRDTPRHAAFVRVTHWINSLSFLVLVLSGVAILLAHPRLYWGETGNLNTPSLIDLPLPFVLDIPIRGPGRYLHFLAAWVSVFTGLVYVATGLATRHFGRNLLPARGELTIGAIRTVIAGHLRFQRSSKAELATYNVLQRLSYTIVVFVMFPLAIWTGLAMSPAVTSVFPFLVTGFGGQQSARTIHFFVACVLTLFSLGHGALVWQTGFKARMRAMTPGAVQAGRSKHERQRLPAEADQDGSRRCSRYWGIGRDCTRCRSLRSNSCKLPRRLRPERNAHVCRATAAYETSFDGARI